MNNKPVWVGYITDKNYNFNDKKQKYGIPPVYIKKDFTVNRNIKKAVIEISSFGVFSAFVNDVEINKDFLSPGWTEYLKRVEYFSYDITKKISFGQNILSFIIADGWYASFLSDVGRNNFGEYPLKLWYRLKIKYVDGTQELIYSDGSEKATASNIVYCDNQNGIKFDNTINYKKNKFENVQVYNLIQPSKAISSKVVAHEIFKGKLISKNKNTYIYDFGQNFSGVIDLSYLGEENDEITIKYGETLYDNGDLYTENLRGAISTDRIIIGGKNLERFFPHLISHGFRYIKIICKGNVKIINVVGVSIYNKLKRVGYFNTSNELINKLYSNVLWAQKSNFLSIPTDCPQRDERLGWTGDAQIFCKTAMLNYNCNNFYKHYLQNLFDSIDIYGAGVPVETPYLFDFLKLKNEIYIGWSGWSDAIIIIPYELYLMYGDISILKQAFSYAENYIKFMLNRTHEYILDIPSYGDWLYIDEELDKTVFNTLYLAYSINLLGKISSILHFDEKKRYYFDLFQRIKDSFYNTFIDENGIIKSDTQSVYILAFAFGVIEKETAKKNIIRKLKQFGNRLTTGFHSTKYILPVLCDLGLSAIAYDLALRTEYPSWGYMVACGATTFWERWDSYKEDSGFNKNGMNSFNHYSLGSIGEWFYTHVLGVNIDENNVAYKNVIIKPYFDHRVDKVFGKIKTKNGIIYVRYLIKNNKINYYIDMPENIKCFFDFNNIVLTKKEKTYLKRRAFEFELTYGG